MGYGRGASFVVAAVLAAVVPAHGMIAMPSPFLPDSTLQNIDSIPPPAPVIKVREIWRGHGSVYYDDGLVAQNSEAGGGSVMLAFAAPDSVEGELGYRFHYVDGNLPRSFSAFPVGAWCANPWREGLWLSIRWADGSTWRQDAFSFRMFITAIDRAGNESRPSNFVAVNHDGVLDAQFERQTMGNLHSRHTVGSIDGLVGNWVGKDEDGAEAILSLAGRQFHVSSGAEVYEGFAQVWKDKDGKPQMTVDAGGAVTFTGPYELQGKRLRLWLRVPTTYKYYDLRRN